MFSENQIKGIISESSTEVVAAIAGQDIAPKDIAATGSITGDEIIENMTGYTFSRYGSGLTNWTPIYVGVCKNGNKITFVIFGSYNAASPSAQALCKFDIPTDIASKLYPYELGTDTDVLDTKVVSFFSGLTTFKSAIVEVEKHPTLPELSFALRPIDLVASTDYYFRTEITFLLSDNLAE